MIKFIVVLFLFGGCKKAPPESDQIAPADNSLGDYNATITRLDGFLLDGFVISHGGDQHLGDSLLWTGVALSGLPCDKGQPLEDALLKMLDKLDGGLYRHPEQLGEPSLDGALGLYRGASYRVAHCNKMDAWKQPLEKHRIWVRNHPKIVAWPFTFLTQAILGLKDKGSAIILEQAVADWAVVTKLTRSACYRVHLGLLTFTTLEETGNLIDPAARTTFCSATSGLDIPTADHWCGRDGLEAFLTDFTYNVWDYRHQRCPAWEAPDANGLETPAVDRLRGLKDFYKFPE